ncbi:MAG: hypothetical protein PHS92_03755 [Candidatus Gracilibacteria bacterium]|nr:hypothetical protein [Candidatus Gracilibacteria bacterium]
MAGLDQVAYYRPPETEVRTSTPEKDNNSGGNVDFKKEGAKRNFTNILNQLGETQNEIDDINSINGDLTRDEIDALLQVKETKKQLLAYNLHVEISDDGVATLRDFDKQTQDELIGELKPENWESLLALPIGGRVEKTIKMGLVLKRLAIRINKLYKDEKLLDSGKEVILKACELAKNGDLYKIKRIIDVLKKSSDTEGTLTRIQKNKIVDELVSTKRDIQKIKTEGRSSRAVEKLSEVEYEPIGRLGDNLHKLFKHNPNTKPEFGNIKDQAFTEIRKFEKWEAKNFKIPDFKEIKEKYIGDFLQMLESHGVNTKNLKNIEDIKSLFTK